MMRFVSQQVNTCLGTVIPTTANFGLAFDKWLDYSQSSGKYEPSVKQDRTSLISQAESLSQAATEMLKMHHLRQARYCRTMEKAGWQPFVFHARLDAPFVSGLGATHPTETGMVLDHTSGMPYIPAASQKGVQRIAHMLCSLRHDDGTEKTIEQLVDEGQVIRRNDDFFWREDDASRTLFGYSEKNDSLAGQLVILDAYPLKAPELGEEILNPHFPEYYKGERGPSEDQSPIPIKFLVVRPGTEFVFRILLRLPYDKAHVREQGKLSRLVQQNIERAITEVGMGAKTSLGFGRFTVVRRGEPEKTNQWIDEYSQQHAATFKEITAALEDKKSPWRAVLHRLPEVSDWGVLKSQVLVNAELSRYQAAQEVGEAVAEMAKKVACTYPKKWTQERDREVADWLQPSGITWEPLAKVKTTATQTSQPMDTRTDNRILETITNFSNEKEQGWQQYKEARIKINKLDKQCAKALKDKFSQWGLKKSRNKAEKQELKKLGRRLKAL